MNGAIIKCRPANSDATTMSILPLDAETVSNCCGTGSAQNEVALLNVPARDVVDEEVTLETMWATFSRTTMRMPGIDTPSTCESLLVGLMEVLWQERQLQQQVVQLVDLWLVGLMEAL